MIAIALMLGGGIALGVCYGLVLMVGGIVWDRVNRGISRKD